MKTVVMIMLQALFLAALPGPAKGQLRYSDHSIDDFFSLTGEWSGEIVSSRLSYRGESRVPVQLSFQRQKNRLRVIITREENGGEVKSKGRVEIKNGLLYFIDDFFEVKQFQRNASEGSLTVVFYKTRKVRGKKFLLKNTLTLEGENLTIRREEQPEDAYEYDLVEEYRLTQISE